MNHQMTNHFTNCVFWEYQGDLGYAYQGYKYIIEHCPEFYEAEIWLAMINAKQGTIIKGISWLECLLKTQ